MYTPSERAPQEFIERYNAILQEKEKIDTPQKLKDFWLFSIETGWKSYEMREYIALLTEQADWKSPIVKCFQTGIEPLPSWYSPSVWLIHNDFATFKAMQLSPNPNQTDEAYLDAEWAAIERDVKDFSPSIYEKLLSEGYGQN